MNAAGANINRPSPILIFGASVRAAAHSALRAGLRPICGDLFGDVDLREAADLLPIDRYPDDFPQAAGSAPVCPWMYTGGLENYPQIVKAVSEGRGLWGNPANVLAEVRDPRRVYEVLRSGRQPAAEVRSADDPPTPDGKWMLKPISGAGGSGIRVWNSGAAESPTLRRPHFFQRRMTGRLLSAVFLGTGETAHLAGVTRQFVGTRSERSRSERSHGFSEIPGISPAAICGALGAPRFAYCGSLGPIRLPGTDRRLVRLQNELAETGRLLVRAFRLRGLFGVDAIWDGRSTRATEVNPRYTASVEVLEHALSLPLLDWHRRACQSSERGGEAAQIGRMFTAAIDRAERERQRCVGKAILFATGDVVTPSLDAFRGPSDGGVPIIADIPLIADIPQPATPIRRRRPICTVLAAGPDRHTCLRRLAERVRRVRRHISANGYS